MVLLELSFLLVCWYWFPLNNFCRDALLYWKFAKGYTIVKYRSSLILVIICKILCKLWPVFDLVAFRDRSDYKDHCFFPFSYQMVGALCWRHFWFSDTSDSRNSSSLFVSWWFYMWHLFCFVSYVAFVLLCFICGICFVIFHMWHLFCFVSYVAFVLLYFICGICFVIFHMWHLFCFVSYVAFVPHLFFLQCLVCVEVLRPIQPIGVMLSAVSLPNHTFTGQA